MANLGIKAACLGTLGIATLWSSRSTKADDTYTNNTLATPIPLSHEVLVYTSNASIVQTDNASVSSLQPYESGIVSLPSDTAGIASTFNLTFGPDPVTAPANSFVADTFHTLTLLGLDANNNVVIGSNGQESLNQILSNVTYAAVQTALENDTAASLASNIIPLAHAPAISFDSTGGLTAFTLSTSIDAANTTILNVDGQPTRGSFVITPAAPEPASAALIGIPAVALLTRRKRTI